MIHHNRNPRFSRLLYFGLAATAFLLLLITQAIALRGRKQPVYTNASQKLLRYIKSMPYSPRGIRPAGRPIPTNITDAAPDGGANNLKCDITIDAQTTPATNTIRVDLDSVGQGAYQSPCYKAATPGTPATPNNGWPCLLSYNSISGTVQTLHLKYVGTAVPSMFTIYAYTNDAPGSPNPLPCVSSVTKPLIPPNTIPANPIATTLLPDTFAFHVLEAGKSTPSQYQFRLPLHNREQIIIECTLTLNRPVIGKDKQEETNMIWVDCDDHKLLQPAEGEWPKKLYFPRQDLSGQGKKGKKGKPKVSFQIRASSQGLSKLTQVVVFAYEKNGNPLAPLCKSPIKLTPERQANK